MTTNQDPQNVSVATAGPVKVNFLSKSFKKIRERSTLLFIAGTVGAFAIGSTFAANISLNTGEGVEFGQGVLSTTSCDDQITITPYSTFINANNAGTHKLTSIKVSGIDSREGSCSGKVFEIRVYSESGLMALVNYRETDYYQDPPAIVQDEDFNFVEVTNTAGEFTWTSGGTDGDDVTNDQNLNDPGRDLSNTSFTINFTSLANSIVRTPLADASDVINITVQSRDGN